MKPLLNIQIKILIISFLGFSCQKQQNLQGTWKLLEGQLVKAGDTTITDYTQNLSFIKIINESHFAFLMHDQDSTKVFSAGGGSYTFDGQHYKERLEYCSDRSWENHEFDFEISMQGDTLIQKGIEKVNGMEQFNTEKYLKIK